MASESLTADPVDTHDPAGMAAFLRKRAEHSREFMKLTSEEQIRHFMKDWQRNILPHFAFRFEQAATMIEQLAMDVARQTTNATAVLQAQHERDCTVEKLVHMSDLLTRARYGFVQHLCHNGKMGGGLSCLACEITAALQGTRTTDP